VEVVAEDMVVEDSEDKVAVEDMVVAEDMAVGDMVAEGTAVEDMVDSVEEALVEAFAEVFLDEEVVVEAFAEEELADVQLVQLDLVEVETFQRIFMNRSNFIRLVKI